MKYVILYLANGSCIIFLQADLVIKAYKRIYIKYYMKLNSPTSL